MFSDAAEARLNCLHTSNPQAAAWKCRRCSVVTWKAADGTEVGGVLELPPDYKKGDKLPLVVAIHGGPTTSPTDFKLRYRTTAGCYFAAKGYAVLCPNYRGSTGYGDKFVTDLIGHENDIEVEGHPGRHPAPHQGRHRRPGHASPSWAGATAAT